MMVVSSESSDFPDVELGQYGERNLTDGAVSDT